jgi:hypothetical protein
MILDVTFKQDAYFLKIHKNFFNNVSTPISLFQADIPLMNRYSNFGLFHTSAQCFGFGGCFWQEMEDKDYILYKFCFPKSFSDISIRQALLSVYLATYYVVEQMFYNKEFFSESIWDDQSLTFVIWNGGEPSSGYAIGGQLYPWFKEKLASLSDDDLFCLNSYVTSELNRVSNYFFKEDVSCGQVTIKRESFFIQVSRNGRWLDWKKNRDIAKPEEFSSHNIDFSYDQTLCFTAIVALNTWLREK